MSNWSDEANYNMFMYVNLEVNRMRTFIDINPVFNI